MSDHSWIFAVAAAWAFTMLLRASSQHHRFNFEKWRLQSEIQARVELKLRNERERAARELARERELRSQFDENIRTAARDKVVEFIRANEGT